VVWNKICGNIVRESICIISKNEVQWLTHLSLTSAGIIYLAGKLKLVKIELA